mmetsp:Transcript_92282/g.287269  ORF Transcript_92282/g.287269 Transcript_92282/m.287269 type:complete len:200 (+) Transcript_92282:641-1240(+)
MEPPARRMRSCSWGRLGLWSSDNGTAPPRRESTARLSPQFATTSASGRTRQTTQVHPTQSGSPSRGSEPRSSSMRWKAATRAPGASSLGPLAISAGSRSLQNSATSLPPWPSMTLKAAVPSQPGPSSAGSAKCASSICTRHPCMQLTPQKMPLFSAAPSPDSFVVTGVCRLCPMLLTGCTWGFVTCRKEPVPLAAPPAP